MTSAHALRVLESFADAGNVSFHRSEAARALAELERSIPGSDSDTWNQRLIEVGESLNLRVRLVECQLEDVLTFVQQGIPLATCQVDPDGDTSWLLIDKLKGREGDMSDANQLLATLCEELTRVTEELQAHLSGIDQATDA